MKTNRLFMVAALAAMFVGCSKEEKGAIPPVDALADTPIAFAVGVEELTTRAGYEAGTLTEGALGFYMQTAGTDAQDARYNGTNRKVEYKNGMWTIVGDLLLWKDKSSEVNYYAYYPYADETQVKDGIITVTVPTDQAKDGVYDLLYTQGTTTGTLSEGGIAIQLKHLMAKLFVKLTKGSELGDVEFANVLLTGLYTKDRFNLSNESSNIRIGYFMLEGDDIADITMMKHADGETFEAIILPNTPSVIGVEITLTDGRKFYYKHGTPTFRSGQIHTLNLKVGKDKVETAAMAVSDWADDGRESTFDTN